jgi:hypothetical protein
MNDHCAAPNIAIVLNRDLLFGARIRTALSALGLQPVFVKSGEQLAAALAGQRERVAIAIVDMNAPVPWDVVSAAIRGADAPPTLAFGPHTDVANRRAAQAAGMTRIVSNGQFHQDMAVLIDRYRRRSN